MKQPKSSMILTLENVVKRIASKPKQHRTEGENRTLKRLNQMLANRALKELREGSHYEGDF